MNWWRSWNGRAARLGVAAGTLIVGPTAASAAAPTAIPSIRTVVLSQGASAVGRPGCTDPSCRLFVVHLRGYEPHSAVTVKCQEPSGTFFSYSRTVDASGNDDSANCYYGFPGRRVKVGAGGLASNTIVWGTPGTTVRLFTGSSAAGRPGCSDASCRFLSVHLRGYQPGSLVSVRCVRGGSAFFSYSRVVDASGNDDSSVCYVALSATTARVVAGQISSNTLSASAGKPFAPPGPVMATEGDAQSQLTFSPAPDNGDPVTAYQVSVNGGPFIPLASDRIVRGLTNGTNYTFRVAGVNRFGLGDPSHTSNVSNPYGLPGIPAVSGSMSGKTLNWSWNTPSGNGRAVDSFDVRLDGGSAQGGLATSFSRTFAPGETHTLRVFAHNARGNGNPGSSTLSTPPSIVMVSKAGSAVGQPSCRFVLVQLRNFAPGSSVSIQCQGDGSTFFTYGRTVDGAGNNDSTNCYYGFPGHQFRAVANGAISNVVIW